MFRYLILALTIACIPQKKETVTTGGVANPNAPSRWPLGTFPKTMKFSNQFSGAELTELQDAATSWTTHAGAGTTFISSSTVAGNLVTDRSGVANLDSLMDGTFGVYKATNWHNELPSTALAVTQIFGIRHNIGDTNEYVEIVEGDILINYDGFTFAPADINGYDLFTVALHEFGHFLGMSHTYNFSSVMYPSIGYSTFYVKPGNVDINTIQSKYGIGGAGSAATRRVAVTETSSSTEDVLNSGRGVRMTLELYANGECVHKTNNTITHFHRVKVR